MRARRVTRRRRLRPCASCLGTAGRAWAADPDGQNTYANAQASGGQLTVQAGHTDWTPPAGSAWATAAKATRRRASRTRTSPTAAPTRREPSATATIGVGGPQPGEWVFPECSGPGVIDPMPPVWVTGAQPAAARCRWTRWWSPSRRCKQLGLGSPTIEMAPPTGSPQLVGVATWLWIDPGAWQTLTATANGGAGHGDGDGGAVEGGVGHGRRRHRHL